MFETKPIDSDLTDHKDQRERLCERRLGEAFKNKTPEWTLEDVKYATKSLNSGISKDPYGHPNELFKEGIAGEVLLKAILKLRNKLKSNPSEYPNVIGLCNVTTIYKNKGDKKDFNSYRGVFRTTSLRNIMDRLIYNDEYQGVDESLTDCNVGSRRNRNIRDNLFVMNAVMNVCKRGEDSPCDINVYEVKNVSTPCGFLSVSTTYSKLD